MKFTLIKDIRQDSFMRPVLSLLLVFIIIYLASDIFVKYSSFGILPSQIASTLYGNEEQFLDAILPSVFLEFWHVEIFFTMMILFTLSAIYIRVAKASKSAIFLVNVMMIGAILALVSLVLAYYASNTFVTLYAVCYLLWHFTALFCAVDALKRFYFA